jgi:energy-converting hydrogenase Eha subunit C
MKLSAPTQILWVLAVIIGTSGIIGHLTPVKYLTEYQFLLVMIGFVLLVIGTLFKKA